jgi:hypothetical protein
MFSVETPVELPPGLRIRNGVESCKGRVTDPVGSDVGERLRTVRLWWTAWLDDEEFSDFVCLTRRALDPTGGPARIVTALHWSIRRKAIIELVGRIVGLSSNARHERRESLTVQATADYHWQPPLQRRRGTKRYPVEERPIRRVWRFSTGDPRTPAFSDGFRELHDTIRQQGWPLDADQRRRLAGLTVQYGQLQLYLA